MFPIFDRLSRPGSALMFTSGTENGIAMGQFEGEPLFHASLAPDEYRVLLSAHGFVVVEMVMEDPHCAGHTIWLAGTCTFRVQPCKISLGQTVQLPDIGRMLLTSKVINGKRLLRQ